MARMGINKQGLKRENTIAERYPLTHHIKLVDSNPKTHKYVNGQMIEEQENLNRIVIMKYKLNDQIQGDAVNLG